MSIFAKAKKAKENKKGFTLVELIVVIVILAILAALLVPALLKWIDKAREKQVVIDGRTAYLAAQTVASEEYGSNNTLDTTVSFDSTTTGDSVGARMAELTDSTNTYSATATFKDNKIDVFVYNDSTLGYTATLKVVDGQGTWTTVKNP